MSCLKKLAIAFIMFIAFLFPCFYAPSSHRGTIAKLPVFLALELPKLTMQ